MSYPLNPWGLADMHGNVWEWCLDHFHASYEGAPADGSPRLKGNDSIRLLRGGSWASLPWFCRSAYRNRDLPANAYYDVGFRVVCSPN